ncbi:hypothetical protein HYT84_01315, partial [Candidatus Micrarchaeota archaeon]|nr:hypothetical protein [Candidatus Micrarchaeota archaeon]
AGPTVALGGLLARAAGELGAAYTIQEQVCAVGVPVEQLKIIEGRN